MKSPPRWTAEELAVDAAKSAAFFRAERLEPTEEWKTQVEAAKAKFEKLFQVTDDFGPRKFTDAAVAKAFKIKLSEALRYLACPPVSTDDLKTIADVDSVSPKVMQTDAVKLKKVFGVLEKVIDPYRFPWVGDHRAPTAQERSAAILASSVLLAAQKVATERRGNAKKAQELRVRDYLRSIGFTEVKAMHVTTIVAGPQARQFSPESKLGTRKADVIVRLGDTRLIPIECKVSNSATNSVKRVVNDAAAKATHWITRFGVDQVIPCAVISGVFKVHNLLQAQDAGLTLFWAHDLEKLGEFIDITKSGA
jgi:hypothetical protein